MRIESYSSDSTVKFGLRDGGVHNNVFECADGNVPSRVEFDWALSVDVAKSLLLLVVGQLNQWNLTHF